MAPFPAGTGPLLTQWGVLCPFAWGRILPYLLLHIFPFPACFGKSTISSAFSRPFRANECRRVLAFDIVETYALSLTGLEWAVTCEVLDWGGLLK